MLTIFLITDNKFGTFTRTMWCRVVHIICNIKDLKKVKHIAYENIQQNSQESNYWVILDILEILDNMVTAL